MSITNYTISNILNFNFGHSGYTAPPSTLYFGLSKTLIDATIVSTTGITEVSGGSYARKSFTNSKSNWSVAALASLYNINALSFVQSTAAWSTDISQVVSIFITDTASSTGNILWFDNILPALTIPSNTILSFPGAIGTGAINISQGILGATLFTANRILDYHFGLTAYTPNSSGSDLYFGLSTTVIKSDGSKTEPTAGDYARAAYTNNKTTWSTSSAGSAITNSVSISFGTTSSGWGTILGLFITDDSSGGDVLWYKNFSNPVYVQSGSAFSYPSSSISFSMS